MRAGDREAVGEFVRYYGAQVRRRVRGGMLRSHSRVFDSEDILSTLARRLDGMVREGDVRAENEGELWSLVLKISGHAVLRKNEVSGRYRRLERGGDENVGRTLSERAASRAEPPDPSRELEMEVARAIELLDDETDREILRLWLAGKSLREISEVLESPQPTIRWRWGRIKQRLRTHLEDQERRL
jgi:DNA-binding CsgD family transcriptional regulator